MARWKGKFAAVIYFKKLRKIFKKSETFIVILTNVLLISHGMSHAFVF